jgi:hypothetical protein
MEQQFPLGQLPHTVPPFEEPHVPSVVTFPVGESIGSPVVVAGGLGVPPVQPFWHPFAARQ